MPDSLLTGWEVLQTNDLKSDDDLFHELRDAHKKETGWRRHLMRVEGINYVKVRV